MSVHEGLPAEAIAEIGALFGSEARLQQDDQDGVGAIWSVERRSENGNLRLLLWPRIARVDATCGPHSWIVRGVRRTEVIDGLEVIFRFGANGLLSVHRSGHAMMVSAEEE